MRKAIVVIGMHRSGTSLATGLIARLGIPYGSNILEANEGNTKGYFEDKSVYSRNELILRTYKTSWDSMTEPKRTEDSFKNSIIVLKDLIKQTYKDYPLFVIKDPRISRLYPEYKEVFKRLKIKPHYIVIERDKDAIKDSLRRRNLMIGDYAIPGYCKGNPDALYDQYQEEMKEYKKNGICFNYKDILENPKGYLYTIAKYVGLNVDEELINKSINGFVDKKLNHCGA